MDKIELVVDRNLLDANFEGYKVSMDQIGFETEMLKENGFSRQRSNRLVSYQHMKIFSNDNHLFIDYSKSTDDQKYLYRFTETGSIQRLIYNFEMNKWKKSIIENVDLGNLERDEAYPPKILFTSQNIVVVSNGIQQIFVYLMVTDDNWQKMLDYQLVEDEKIGFDLIEAQIFEKTLKIVGNRVEKSDENRIFWITIDLSEIDYCESLKVLKKTEIVQNGHFETCTIDNLANLIIVGEKKPRIVGKEPEIADELINKKSWKQIDKSIEITFDINCEVTKEDIKLSSTKTSIFLAIHDTILMNNNKLFGEIDENSLEINVKKSEKKLLLKFETINDEKWNKLEDERIEKKRKRFGEEKNDDDDDEQICGVDEETEECDDVEATMFFYWIEETNGNIFRQCDVSGHQILFTSRNNLSPAIICLRHDVDGILWQLNNQPKHIKTLQAFGYVQASKTTRAWSGTCPNMQYACIVEAMNRILIYSQKVAVEGNLINRKTSSKITHISKQHLLKLESSDFITGVAAFDNSLICLTKNSIHVAILQQ